MMGQVEIWIWITVIFSLDTEEHRDSSESNKASRTYFEKEFGVLECGIGGWVRASCIFRFQFFYIASSTDLIESFEFLKGLVVWILHIPALKLVQEESDSMSGSCLTLSLPFFYCFWWCACREWAEETVSNCSHKMTLSSVIDQTL